MSELQRAVDSFVIGDPIKTLFRPRFDVELDNQRKICKLQLQCWAPDAYGEKGVIQVKLQREFSADLLAETYRIHSLMRGMLHEILLHEADESITVNGWRKYDPHKYA